MTENSAKTATRGRPFPKGKSGNPNGRPEGQRNYATLYREAIVKIAKSKSMTPEELEEEIVKSGLENALKGDYRFYQDALDRLHGKPKQGVEVTGKDGGEITTHVTVEFVRGPGKDS